MGGLTFACVALTDCTLTGQFSTFYQNMPQAHASSLTITPTITPRNYSIDAFRLLGAIAVILLHVQYRGLSNEVVLPLRWFGRFAVPFFL